MTRQIEIEHLAPEALSPNPWNSNRVGPEMEQRLRRSIEKMGFYKPIVAREVDGQLQILGGEHRWRVACSMGLQTVPVVNLGAISDKQAKTIGLADNGQYGEDDARLLAQILRDIGEDDVADLLPYSADDLAGMFAVSDVDLDSLGLDDDPTRDIEDGAPEAPRATITHELMRFKVPVEDRERVQKLIEEIIAREGLKSEADSMVAAGMALVAMAKLAREAM